MTKRALTLLATACAVVALTGCETTNMKMGSSDAKTVATGAAGGANAANESAQLERCQSPLGTVSLVENQDAGWYTILRNEYRLPPTANLLRLLVQQLIKEAKVVQDVRARSEREVSQFMKTGQAAENQRVGQLLNDVL